MKRLFLTYQGMLRVLFTSRSGAANRFVKWATETLFAVHLGTDNQKNKLIGKMKGVDSKTVKEVFNKSSRKLPCVYLFSLGKIKDVRKTFDVPSSFNDNDTLYKYGKSIDLEQRTNQHKVTYGTMKSVALSLIIYEYIDPLFISDAENNIANFFNVSTMKLNHSTYNELVIIPDKQMSKIKTLYLNTANAFMGHVAEMSRQLKEKDSEIALIRAKH